MGEEKDVRDGEAYCRVPREASGPTSDDVPCPLPHATARCPVCWVGWIGPGPDDGVVLCILTRHIVETHPNTAHATTLRFNAVQLGGSADPDAWCHHDPEQHRRAQDPPAPVVSVFDLDEERQRRNDGVLAECYELFERQTPQPRSASTARHRADRASQAAIARRLKRPDAAGASVGFRKRRPVR